MKRALICGATGQDGSYLSRLLIGKGYQVFGTSRDATMASGQNFARLGIQEKLTLLSMAPNDFRSVLGAIERAEPDEIYYLAGQSSVGLSFEQPAETIESITIGTLNILEAMRMRACGTRLYHAGSSECFGDTGGQQATEETPFRPRSPYAVAKSSAHWLIANYREAYGLFACNGILFNHESPLRPRRFVTQKIVAGAVAIADGRMNKLQLGNIDVSRDWGWAPEFVEAMWLMLQQDCADDYIVATGHTSSLEDFVAAAFDAVGLRWHDHVTLDPGQQRPTDLSWSGGTPEKAARQLGWKPQTRMPGLVAAMVNAERKVWERDGSGA
ncbi:MAG: GDP-mannose 4,6-dehydratase [Pacificimonas sp.]